MNKNTSIVFLGAGNMAEALVKGIVDSGLAAPDSLCLTDIRAERLEQMRDQYGVRGTQDNTAAVRAADVVLLCVKPQQMQEVLTPLRGLNSGALWVSIAAGVTTSAIEKALGGEARVVRVMPNTPALVRKGAAGIAKGAFATGQDIEMVCELMESVGICEVVEEEDLHAVTALSGSGPAYVFYLVESLLAAAAELGLEPGAARRLAVQTVIGAGELLAAESETEPGVLRERVTSKGGTTAAALAAFEAGGVGAGLRQGVLAAAARSRELAG